MGTRAPQSSLPEFHDSRLLRVYDIETEKWIIFQTNGDGDVMPIENSGCCGLIYHDYLYVCGATNRKASRRELSLYKLNLRTLTWEYSEPKSGDRPLFRNKFVGWPHEDKLYFFGGYGESPSGVPENDTSHSKIRFLYGKNDFVSDLESNNFLSWNNQLICYDLTNNVWELLQTAGQKPSPRAAHAAVKVDESTVIVFGGRHQNERLNDLYSFDILSNTWRQIVTNQVPWPIGRSWHAMDLVDENRILLHGGLTTDGTPLSDLWTLDLKNMSWNELTNVKSFFAPPLVWHSGRTIANNFYIFGGCSANILQNPKMSDYSSATFVIKFQTDSLKTLCLKALASSAKAKKMSHMLPNNLKLKFSILTNNVTFSSSLMDFAR
uniref:Uncharacterized protein n=1 Tax=Romanomermis culicivorax TaxID=13658 RepID=A0A915L7L9_ROMCU